MHMIHYETLGCIVSNLRQRDNMRLELCVRLEATAYLHVKSFNCVKLAQNPSCQSK